MRVTSSMIFDTGLQQMQKQNKQLLDTYTQVVTGRRVLQPSDDPVAAARALEIGQSRSVNELHVANQGYANDALKLVDSKLGAANDIVTYVRTRAVEAGNGSYSAQDRKYIAEDISQQFAALQEIANSRDGTGDYLFGGYNSNVQPFQGGVLDGVTYKGDQGVRTLQISATRNLPVTNSGDVIFNTIRAPAGSPFALSDPQNSGNALFSGADLAAYNGHSYQIAYQASPLPAVFNVTDQVTGTTTPVTPSLGPNGETLVAFDGISLNLEGSLGDGDRYTLSPVGRAFDLMGNFIQGLESGNHRVSNFQSGQTLAGMDGVQDSINQTRAGVGSRLQEVATQQDISGSLDINYAEALSRLQDVDYAEAISSLTQQQTFLQAAQQSFLRVSNLSLFNYL